MVPDDPQSDTERPEPSSDSQGSRVPSPPHSLPHEDEGSGPSTATWAIPQHDAAAPLDPQAGPQLSLNPPLEEDQPTIISNEENPSYSLPRFRSSDLAEQLQGVMLDHYRLEQYIGGGGMGAVFKAHDTLLSRTVAVKVLSRRGDDPEMLRRFSNEAQSAAKLDHENIARVFFVGQDRGWSYIVFEFVEGRNLRQIVADQGPLELDLALRYMCQMTRALEHAGHRDVIHRDIKPSNVIVTSDHRVKLVDMGLARMQRLGAEQEDLTASGMTLGTFDYISPEQARNPRDADTRSDIYSLGCTFFFLLTGSPPFPEGTPIQKLLSHQEAPRPDLAAIRPELPEVITRIVLKQLAPSPAQRYQSPNELLADLLVAAHELGIDVGLKESLIIEPIETQSGWLGHLIPIVVPAIALILTLILLELFLRQPTEDEAALAPRYQQVVSRPESGNDRVTPTPSDLDSNLPIPAPLDRPPSPSPAGRGRTVPTEAGGNFTSPPEVTPSPDTTAERPPSGNMIRRLRIGRDLAQFPGAINFESFDDAIEMANADDGIETIELCFNGFITIEPMRIESRKLSLVAGDGYRPGLRFTAGTGRLSTPHLVRVFSEEFSVQGLNLEVVLAGESSWRQISWFHLEQDYTRYVNEYEEAPIQDFEFIDCRFTVIESPSVPTADLPTLSMIQINRPTSFFLELPTVDVAQFPNLLLRKLWVRGNCHLIRAAPATPFYAQWERSLFVSNKAACFLGGSPGRDPIAGTTLPLSPSQLVVDQVTLASAGLLELRVTTADPDPLHVDIETNRCWFNLPPNAPLLHHRLLSPNSVKEDLIRLSGQQNLMTADTALWQIDVAGRVDLIEYIAAPPTDQTWFNLAATEVNSTVPAVLEPFLLGQRPASQFKMDDFVQINESLTASLGKNFGVLLTDLNVNDSSASEPPSMIE